MPLPDPILNSLEKKLINKQLSCLSRDLKSGPGSGPGGTETGTGIKIFFSPGPGPGPGLEKSDFVDPYAYQLYEKFEKLLNRISII